jgi:hypothetical protein
MATAKQGATAKPHRFNRAGPRQGPRRHRLRNGLIMFAMLAAVGTALFWRQLQAQAMLGASYGARMACTCHYIEGRGLKDCAKDFEPGMALVMLSQGDGRSVTARVPLVASQTAIFREGVGCQLQAWAP